MARNRNVQIIFWVSENEKSMIEEKMAQAGMTNLSAYLRRIAIDDRPAGTAGAERNGLASALRQQQHQSDRAADE